MHAKCFLNCMFSSSEAESSPAMNKFNNDGSFLEQFKKLKNKTGMTKCLFWLLTFALLSLSFSTSYKVGRGY